jgi:hypothetical protein
MITFYHKDLEIEIINDETYTGNSSDNKFVYDYVYTDSQAQEYQPTSRHGIFLKKNDEVIKSAILLGASGATGIHKNSAIIVDDCILICVSNCLFSISLPDLVLNWIKEDVDMATCFQIFDTDHGIIVHGELAISKITSKGDFIWMFGGKDIFVTSESGNEIELEENYIKLTDWNGDKYMIDYNGNEIR